MVEKLSIRRDSRDLSPSISLSLSPLASNKKRTDPNLTFTKRPNRNLSNSNFEIRNLHVLPRFIIDHDFEDNIFDVRWNRFLRDCFD